MRVGTAAHSVDAGAKELVEHVVFVGGYHQFINRQAHAARHMASADVAKVARRNGEADFLVVAFRRLHVASNFERFVFDLLGRDGARVQALFGDALAKEGRFDLSGDPAFADAAQKYGFVSGKSTHADRLATIRDTHQRFGVTIDTHTAGGVKVARQHLQTGQPMLVLETALPIKFAETIEEALGHAPERPAKFDGIEALPKRVQVMACDVQLVKDYIARHCDA